MMQVSLFPKLKGQVLLNKRNDLFSQLPDMIDALQSGKLVEFETHGFSMIPLLHDGGDRVVLKKAENQLNIDDVVLCKTDEGKYVLHRVISTENGYTLKGDNCMTTEHCAGDADVVGVATAFIRNGKTISVDSRYYRFYVHHRAFFLGLWRLFWRITDWFVKRFRK